MAEQFEFEVKFVTDPRGHPRMSSTPCTVITLRGRRVLKYFLLLYESLGSFNNDRSPRVKPASVDISSVRGDF